MTADERNQIRAVLSTVADNERRQVDGRTELQWMADSCPSLAHAVDEANRRWQRHMSRLPR